MVIGALIHVPFEQPGLIEEWAKDRGHDFVKIKLYENETPPPPDVFDLLVIMGGPMGVYDDKKYPFLSFEKEYLKDALKSKTYLLGVCLGAQLLAYTLGSRIIKNTYPEIGFFPIYFNAQAQLSYPFRQFVKVKTKIAFHYHEDTFEIPRNALKLARSEFCENQAFSYNHDKVIGLQYHWEITPSLLYDILENTYNYIPQQSIQDKKIILKLAEEYEEEFRDNMYSFLFKLEELILR
jgi:GMP synthase (glutamine-hydrolysing)